ncbi:unnamed protein product [Rotaria sp. Silwood2]|nr:unnamed protein product [Rotaria sp. Silwood2]
MSNIYIEEPTTRGKVLLDTTVGNIEIELFSNECPLACRNFLQLCMDGYYDGTIFYRVVPNFIAQGGYSTGTGEGTEPTSGKFFQDEFDIRLCYNRRGLVGMVNQGPNTNASQFFFTLDSTPEFDKKNTLFGKVIGNTLFNMLKLGEGEIIDDIPVHKHKIIKTEIISNPFDNMVPRPRAKSQIIDDNDEENKKSKPTVSDKAIKNYDRLSLGNEAAEETRKISMKFQVQQRSNAKQLGKQEKRKSIVLDADDDDDDQQDISSTKLNENVKTEQLKKVLKPSKKSSIRVKVSEDTLQEIKESSSHLIQPMTTDTSTVMNELVADTEGNNNIRISSLIQPMTPKYNLKSQKMTDEHIDDLKEQLNYVKIDENTMINITALIEYKNIKPRPGGSERIQQQINQIEKIIEEYLLKLPSLTSIEEYQLVISNKHWPYIKDQTPSLCYLNGFFSLLQFLLDKEILKKFDETFNEDDIFFSYIITGVAYLIVASNPCCSNPDVNNFILIVSNGFPPVNTSCEAFINFFKLLQSILSSRFVIELYRELINYEENVSQETIEQSLKDNISNLQKHMYLANLPDNYYALTLYDGKLLLNSSARGSDDDSIILSWAALLIVILDEIAHSLQRTIIPKARNLILAQTSPKNVLDGQREAGFCFETLVFGHKVESIGLLDGKYLLNSTNWNVGNAESFQNKLKEATTKDEEKTRKISAQVTIYVHISVIVIAYSKFKTRLLTVSAIIGRSTGRDKLLSLKIHCEFVEPLMSFSKTDLYFGVEYNEQTMIDGLRTPISTELKFSNISAIDLISTLHVKHPFLLKNKCGNLGLKSESYVYFKK